MELEDIKKLALIARVDMPEEEMQTIAESFGSILAYLEEVKNLKLEAISPVYLDTNKFREDVVTNTSGGYTDKIIAEFPDQQDGYLKVKQIL